MSDLNIDDFYKDAARTLVALYNVFPRPIPIYVEDIAGPDEPDEYGVHSHRHQACFAALVWLGEEGLLRYDDTIKTEAIDQAVLTGRCLSALLSPLESPGVELPGEPGEVPRAGQYAAQLAAQDDVPPSVREQRRTHIHHLSRAVAEKSSITIREALLPLLTRLTS